MDDLQQSFVVVSVIIVAIHATASASARQIGRIAINHLIASESGGCQKFQRIGFDVRSKGWKGATPVFDDFWVSINGEGLISWFLVT